MSDTLPFEAPQLYDSLGDDYEEWARKTLTRWKESIGKLIGHVPPEISVWTEAGAVAEVLQTATESDRHAEYAYLMLPESGDMPVHGAREHWEEGTVLIEDDPEVVTGYVVKPESVKLKVPSGDVRFAYLWVEADKLKPSGVYDSYEDRHREYVCEVNETYVRGSQYEESGMWTNEKGEREPLPDHARTVTRYFEGSFLICCKSNPYVQMSSGIAKFASDNGAHAKLGEERFFREMEKMSAKL